ncbi:MAG: NAD(+) synthase [Ignavibacteriales bacterium]|nr:NAD(+) synthase [Ignavibacteriales bacterium]
MKFSKDVLKINTKAEIEKIASAIREHVIDTLHKRGAVVGISGGIDSSVCAALCVSALGKENVFGLFMPERDSSSESLLLGTLLAKTFGINSIVEDIKPLLEGAGCYRRQSEAIREVFPEYGYNWKSKVTIPSILDKERLNVLRITVELPTGEQKTTRMPIGAYLKLIAATNWKQRSRKIMEYYHADRLNYAVCGTPNRLEYDQGFFVKNGDGSADFKPIAHLYKSQVYMIAEALGVPKEIRSRPPTTDTYSLPQTQEEFYFALPYDKMDLCLYGINHNISPADVAPAVELTAEQVERVYKDIESKRRGTKFLHLSPLLVEPVIEIKH